MSGRTIYTRLRALFVVTLSKWKVKRKQKTGYHASFTVTLTTVKVALGAVPETETATSRIGSSPGCNYLIVENCREPEVF